MSTKSDDNTASVQRFERFIKRRKNKTLVTVPEMESEQSECDEVKERELFVTGNPWGTEKEDLLQKIKNLEDQIKSSADKITSIQKQKEQAKQKSIDIEKELNKYTINEDFFENTEKVKFYTGLPNKEILYSIYNMVAPHIESSGNTKLTKYQQLVMTLMRLRLWLQEKDLAYRFQVSQSTVSKIFQRWIGVMRKRLEFLVYWPERDELYKTMPMCFQESFGRCAIVIDCFEVYIEKSSDFMARATTFSSYKHHNTLKILIGITPQGTISFIS